MTGGVTPVANVHELSPKRRGMKASIYLLPNMITAASLFFGFLSMKFAMEGRLPDANPQAFLYAAYAILAAAVCDGLDGSVARLTRTQSAFGVQLDSLCDMVSFGIVPAFVIYNYALYSSSRIGFAACFIYAICGALRLARFNVQSSVGKAGGNFTGIPIPMAAMPLCAFIMSQYEFSSWTIANNYSGWAVKLAETLARPDVKNIFLICLMFALAFGMISTFEYVSTKNIKLPRKRPFRFLSVLLMITVLLFTLEFTVTLSLLLILYCLHGPVMWLFFKRDRTADEEDLFIAGDEEDDEEETHT
jgi:CDP-diacylglycerol--serine O-phosphatidyltransferase